MKKLFGIILVIIAVFIVVSTTSKKHSMEPLPRNELQHDGLYEGELDGVENADYSIDAESSRISWTGRTLVKSHMGTLVFESGELQTLNGNVVGSFVIDMSSLFTGDGEAVTNDLKSENFFDVATYPTAEFTVNNYSGGELQGDLNIKGVSQPVSLPVSIDVGDSTLRIQGDVLIDRTLWGIEYRSASIFSNLGDKAINDNVEISIDALLRAKNEGGE